MIPIIVAILCVLSGFTVIWVFSSRKQMENAVRAGKVQTVKKMLKKNPSLASQHFRDGITPISRAAVSGNTAMVELLIHYGADVNAQDKDELGGSALKWAALYGPEDLCECLLRHGADVNQICNFHWTPLHEATRSANPNLMALLLTHGAKVDSQSHNGWTPLHIAAADGNLEMVKLLTAAKANLWICNEDGHSAVELAKNRRHEKIVHFLTEEAVSKENS